MEARPADHPPAEILQAFALGKLTDDAAEAVLRHVERCSDCEAKAALASDDDFLHQLRQAKEPSGGLVADMGPPTPGDVAPTPVVGGTEPEAGPSQAALATGASPVQVPGYDILGVLGRGGMGVVYKARQIKLDRLVALKTILSGKDAEPQDLARFRTEAEAVARFQHPNIVQIYEVGEHDGLHFFSMELCGGGSLKEKPGGFPLAPREAAALVETLARGIHAAHGKAVVHRDLKPANVLVGEDGTPKISDFGLAKKLDVEKGDTLSGAIMGSPNYMAPEQAQGKSKKVGRAADVYALGAILYECLTGRPPFMAANIVDTLAQVVNDDPVPVRRLQPSVARDLETICLKCLQKDPAKRYATAANLADDLRRFQAGEPIRARPVGAVERAWRWCKRYPAWAGLAAAVCLLVATGGTVSWWLWQQQAINVAHQQATDQKTRLTVDQARELLEKAWKANNAARLAEARADADKAFEIAHTGGASAEVQKEAEALQQEVRDRLAQADRNETLLTALLDVAEPSVRKTKRGAAVGPLAAVAEPSVEDQFSGAFRRWGVDVDGTPEQEAAARLGQQPEQVVQQVAAGLGEWALDRRNHKRPEAEWRRLHDLADRLDGDERRRELRRIWVGGDLETERIRLDMFRAFAPWSSPDDWPIAPNVHRLRELADQLEPVYEPVLGVVTLSRTLESAGEDRRAEGVLRAALAAHPGEVVLLDALGKLLVRQRPQRWGEAIECYRAARAARPDLGVALASVLDSAGRMSESEAVLRDLVRRQPRNPDMRFHLGKVLYDQQRLDEALAAYRTAIDLDPDFAEAFTNIGVALFDQQKPDEAEAAYRKAIDLAPGLAEAHTGLGNALQNKRKLDEAEAAYRKAIDLEPDFAEAYYNLGLALYNPKRPGEAVAAWRKAIDLKPDLAQAYNNLGNAFWLQGQLDDALAALQKAVTLKPNFAQAYNNLGNVLRDQQKPSEAEAAWRKAIDIQPDLADPYNNLGFSLLAQGKLDDAEAALLKAVALKPDFAEAYVNLGNLRFGQHRLDEAATFYRQAIDRKPEYAWAGYNGLGIVLAAQDKLDEAVAAFRKATDLKPDFGEGYYNLGIALQRQQQLGEAIAAYRKAIELLTHTAGAGVAAGDTLSVARNDRDMHSMQADMYVSLGNALSDQHKPAEAMGAYRKAIDLKPDFGEAYFRLGAALGDQQNLDEAADAFRKAAELQPRKAEVYYCLGIVLSSQQKLDKAADAFQKAIDLRPDDADFHYRLGDALKALGRLDEAAAAFRKAADLKPDYALAYHQLGLVLSDQQHWHEAAAAFRKLVSLKPDLAAAYLELGVSLFHQRELDEAATALRTGIDLKPDVAAEVYYQYLGDALFAQQKLDEAVAAFRKAIDLKPDDEDAYLDLGFALREQGQFSESVVVLRRWQQVRSKKLLFDFGAEAWVHSGKRLVALEVMLPAFLKGEAEPADAVVCFDAAEVCRCKGFYLAGARFAEQGFLKQPNVADGFADDIQATQRFHAIRAAALAGCGKGKDATEGDDKERAHWRKKALEWLRIEFDSWSKKLQSENQQSRAAAAVMLWRWKESSDLAGVRGDDGLAKLPAEEQVGWHRLWDDVDALLKKAQEK